MKVVVASGNPVKVRSAEAGFRRLFPTESIQVHSVAVPSGVRDQPMGDEETRRGAENRARAAEKGRPEADFWVGLEGGVEVSRDQKLFAFAWVAVRGRGVEGVSRTASFQLPEAVAALVRQGMELGKADDQVFGRENSKHQGGAVGILTEERIDRAALYEPAVSLALIPFLNPDLFPSDDGAPDQRK